MAVSFGSWGCALTAFAVLISVPASGCTLYKVAEMPLIDIGEHFAVMGKINFQSSPFIVDTGAAATLIKDKVVGDNAIALDPIASHATAVSGIGNSGPPIYNALPFFLGFGQIGFRDRSTVVARMGDLDGSLKDVAGLLGDDVMSQFDVEMDFPDRRITFYKNAGCRGQYAPWKEPYSSGAFRRHNSEIVIDGSANGHPLDVVVDTGAAMSFMSRRAALASGAKDADMTLTSASVVSPFNEGERMPVRSVAFSSFVVARSDLSGRAVGVVDVEVPGGDMLLGLDFLRTTKIWFGYSSGSIFIADRHVEASHPF